MTRPHDIFDAWYRDDSDYTGPGSTPESTVEYRVILSSLIEALPEGGVILDWGCGDWDHSRLVDWGEREYVGVDVSPTLIDRLNRRYATETTTFHLYDPDSGDDPASFLSRLCPHAELAVCKDVLQHLSNDESVQIVRALLSTGADILLTNDMLESSDDNQDGPTGGCRHIDPRTAPFSLSAELLLKLTNRKSTFIIRQERQWQTRR